MIPYTKKWREKKAKQKKRDDKHRAVLAKVANLCEEITRTSVTISDRKKVTAHD